MIYDVMVESEYYCQKCKRIHQTRVKGFTKKNDQLLSVINMRKWIHWLKDSKQSHEHRIEEI